MTDNCGINRIRRCYFQEYPKAEKAFMQVLKLDKNCEDAMQELIRVRTQQLTVSLLAVSRLYTCRSSVFSDAMIVSCAAFVSVVCRL